MYKKILVPIAPDHRPNTGGAVDVARALLEDGGTINALTVVESIPSYAAQQLPSGLLEQNIAEMDNDLKAEFGGIKGMITSVVVGHAAMTILEQADDIGADCIVIASHKPGLADYFLGSTAGRVVRHAKCAVHVIR